MNRLVRLSKAADILDVSVWTLRKAVKAGQIRAVRTETGRFFIPESELPVSETLTDGNRVALYARESSSENKSAMRSQLDVLRAYAAAKGWQVTHEVQEYASGMNDQRPKLHALITRTDFDVLLVENKDRLTRFGFRWFESLASFRVEVVNIAATESDDLMEDLVAVVTSFAARLYGQRRGRERSIKAIAALRVVPDET